jgi:hypothetical protein
MDKHMLTGDNLSQAGMRKIGNIDEKITRVVQGSMKSQHL